MKKIIIGLVWGILGGIAISLSSMDYTDYEEIEDNFAICSTFFTENKFAIVKGNEVIAEYTMSSIDFSHGRLSVVRDNEGN